MEDPPIPPTRESSLVRGSHRPVLWLLALQVAVFLAHLVVQIVLRVWQEVAPAHAFLGTTPEVVADVTSYALLVALALSFTANAVLAFLGAIAFLTARDRLDARALGAHLLNWVLVALLAHHLVFHTGTLLAA